MTLINVQFVYKTATERRRASGTQLTLYSAPITVIDYDWATILVDFEKQVFLDSECKRIVLLNK